MYSTLKMSACTCSATPHKHLCTLDCMSASFLVCVCVCVCVCVLCVCVLCECAHLLHLTSECSLQPRSLRIATPARLCRVSGSSWTPLAVLTAAVKQHWLVGADMFAPFQSVALGRGNCSCLGNLVTCAVANQMPVSNVPNI